VQDKGRESISFDDFDGVVGDGSNDDTAGMQAALDAAPAGSFVVGTPGKTYNFTRIQTTKALTIDFRGADLIVDPSEGNTVTGQGGAIQFSGSVGTAYAVNDTTVRGSIITCTTAAQAGNFAAGDMVFIQDQKFVPAWDDLDADGTGSSTVSSTGSTGKHEVNYVVAANAGTGAITLSKPTEHIYATTVTVAKVTPVMRPAVLNMGSVTEPNPGSAYASSVSGGPNIVTFNYCAHPHVEGGTVDGFNLRVVQFNKCWMPTQSRMTARNAYRPSLGGHGYLVQFFGCVGGDAGFNEAFNCRHTVDFSLSYDCVSHDSVTHDSYGTAYYCHGLSSRRCKSVDDTVYQSDQLTSSGWAAGNPTFAADYDYEITRPNYYGVSGDAIVSFGYSDALTVIDPLIVFKKPVANTSIARAVHVRTGATNTVIRGGTIDLSQCFGSASDTAIATTGTASGGGAYSVPPENIRVDGKTKIIMPNAAVSAMNFTNINGDVILAPHVVGGGTTCNGPRIQSTATPTNIIIEEGEYSGSFGRGIYVQAAPSGIYRVRDNSSRGTYATGFLSLTALSAALVMDDVPGVNLPGNGGLGATAGNTESTIIFATPITADRSVTLSTSQVCTGARFRIVRTAAATGAFNVNVGTGPLKALAAGTWCEVTYDGAAWVLTAYGAL
jgi:hypothetical protein